MRSRLLAFSFGLAALLGVASTPSPAQAAPATASVTVVHGVPGLTVDVYVNGTLTLPGFEPRTIAGPLDLPARCARSATASRRPWRSGPCR